MEIDYLAVLSVLFLLLMTVFTILPVLGAMAGIDRYFDAMAFGAALILCFTIPILLLIGLMLSFSYLYGLA